MEIIPFDQRTGIIWYNGEFIDWQDAKIHILNHGLHYGGAVFEGIRSYSGKIFKLQEHIERFHNSAKLLGYTIPYSISELNKATNELLIKQNLTDSYIRPVAWRGSEKMTISAPNNKIHTAIAAWNWPGNYYAERQKGIKLCMAKWKRPAPDAYPCQSKAAGGYVISTLSKQDAETRGYNDALMLDSEGFIAETTSSNIFFIKNNELHTPIADSFLNGITRLTVIEIAKTNNIKVIERKISLNELKDFDEIIVTGTAVEITPVIQIEKMEFKIGELTNLLIDKYTELTK